MIQIFQKILRDSMIELSWKIDDTSDATSSKLIQLVKRDLNLYGDKRAVLLTYGIRYLNQSKHQNHRLNIY